MKCILYADDTSFILSDCGVMSVFIRILFSLVFILVYGQHLALSNKKANFVFFLSLRTVLLNKLVLDLRTGHKISPSILAYD